MEKRFEKSCGAVVFTRRAGKRYYVIVCGTEGIWGFPKGHMEAGETEVETALREIREETGLSVTLLPGFRETEEYALVREGRPDTVKQVVYFLAEYGDQAYRPQEGEIAGIRLAEYSEAMALFRYDAHRRVLTDAENFLLKNENFSLDAPECS